MREGNEWSQAWLDTQRQYWDTLFNWSKAVSEAGLAKPAAGNGGSSLEDWWKNASAMLPPANKEVYRRVLDAGRSFFETGELFWNLARDAQEAGENWRQSLEQGLEDLKATLQENATQAADAWSGFAGGWGVSGDAWQDFMKSLGQSPVHAEAVTGFNAGEAWNRLLSMPALGYTREWQEKVQQWGILAGDYAKVAQEYAALLNTTNRKAVDLLGRRLVELTPKGESPVTFRGMYDLWVDCGEEAYGELVEDDDYLKCQGQLMNSLMRLRQHEQDMVQDVLSALNIPGRRELNTALCRLQETRRELRDLRDAIDDAGMLELQKEISRLGGEVSRLRHELTTMKSATPPVKPQAAGERAATPAAKSAASPKTAVQKPATPARKMTAKKTAKKKATTRKAQRGT